MLLGFLRSLALRRGFLGGLLSCFLLLHSHEFYLQVCAKRKTFPQISIERSERSTTSERSCLNSEMSVVTRHHTE